MGAKKLKKDSPGSVSLDVLQKRFEDVTSSPPLQGTPPSPAVQITSVVQKKVRNKKTAARNCSSEANPEQHNLPNVTDIKQESTIKQEQSEENIEDRNFSPPTNPPHLQMPLAELKPVIKSEMVECTLDIVAEAEHVKVENEAEDVVLDDVGEEISDIEGGNDDDDDSSELDSIEDATLVIDAPPPPSPKKSPKKAGSSKSNTMQNNDYDVDIGTQQPPVYSNTQDMITKFQTSAEKKARKKKKKIKGSKDGKADDP